MNLLYFEQKGKKSRAIRRQNKKMSEQFYQALNEFTNAYDTFVFSSNIGISSNLLDLIKSTKKMIKCCQEVRNDKSIDHKTIMDIHCVMNNGIQSVFDYLEKSRYSPEIQHTGFKRKILL